MLIAVAAVALTAFGITTWLLTIASHAATGTDLTTARLNAVRTGLAAGAGAGAAVGLMLAFRRQHHQEIATLLTDQDATQRRITELYIKAVEQLGSDKAPVRLGGLYALERLAQDNPAQRQTIVNVICAYLRMPFPPTPDSATPCPPDGNPASAHTETTSTPSLADNAWQQEKQVRLTAQRILSDHLRRTGTSQDAATTASAHFWHDMRLDLTGATLIDFSLNYCIVSEAQFAGATFNGTAQFGEVTFNSDAGFCEATFDGAARFDGATFSGTARFDGAIFSDAAWFGGAIFSDAAWFGEATLNPAGFGGATFNGAAGFGGAIFSGAAGFGGATFNGAAQFGEATFNDTAGFNGATFNGTAGFGEATFNGTAGFRGATFRITAWFGEATFDGAARFGEAIFNGRGAWFERATFGGETWFDEPSSKSGVHGHSG